MSHKDLEDYIESVYDFKNLWLQKCSKYEINTQPHVLPPVNRIIVIGDVHGDWNILIESLKIAKLINNNNNWIGGDSVVVQVGDQIDRCRYNGIECSRKDATQPDEGNDWKILKYFTELHQQAQKVGGAVYSLLGNHELMNVKGDFRYVSYMGLKEFDNLTFFDDNGNKHLFNNGEDARKWAFKPGNLISDFLACTRQTSIIIGSNLFVHAGILPNIAKKYSIKSLNQIMSLYLFNKINNPEQYNDIINSSDYSPLWTRMFGNIGLNKYTEPTKLCSELLNPLNDIYKIDKIFVGHTPILNKGITSVCNNKVWLTDYGSSKAFDKFSNGYRKAQVLEILRDGEEINILK